MEKMDGISIFEEDERLKERFPKTYEAIQNTKRMRRSVASDEIVRTNFLGLMEDEQASLRSSSQNIDLLFECVTAKRYVSGYMHMEAKAVRKSTGEILNRARQVVFFTREGEKNGLIMALKINEGEQKDCKLCLECGIVEEKGVTTKTHEYDLAEYDIIRNSYHIAHPRRKEGHPKEDPYINYYFWRSPAHGEYVDYKYSDGYTLMCKSEGTAFAMGYAVREIISASLILENENDLIEYPDFIKKVDFYEQGVQWGGVEDWKRRISELLKSNTGFVSYTLSIICHLEDMGSTRHTFLITNKEGAANLPMLRFCWGCLAAGTKILTAAGEKRIENIRVGDMIDYEGELRPVCNTWRGTECNPVIIIRLDNGREVTATSNHPFLTEQGMRPANEIGKGTMVKTREEGFVPVAEIYADFLGEIPVYNLEVEEEGTFYANGIASGDMRHQNSCKGENVRAKLPEEWRQDFDSFMDLLKEEA